MWGSVERLRQAAMQVDVEETERERKQAEKEVFTVVPKLGVRAPCGVP
jgi:hypothetical protein